MGLAATEKMPFLLSPLHSEHWVPINCASSLLTTLKVIYLHKEDGNKKRHWGACILCLWLVSSKQPTSSPGPYLEQNWKSHCHPLPFFKSQLFWALLCWCSASSRHSFVWSLWADNWAPLMFHVSFSCQDTQGSVEGFIPATLSVPLAGLLFILLAFWVVLLWLLFIHSFFLHYTSVYCLPRPCERWGGGGSQGMQQWASHTLF